MQPQLKPTTTPSLDALYSLIQADLKRVDEALLARVEKNAAMIQEVAKHIIASGGKRIRPAMTLISAQLCGYQGSQHVSLAAAVELLHTATLLHDDVVDESNLRRGLATANHVFGNKASILVGDFLLGQAFQLMATDGTIEALQILSDASAVISQGEVLQLMQEGNIDIAEQDYMTIISSKTAVLFACASELGAVISEKPEWQPSLKSYGSAVGMAFQLVDDALDYNADQKKLGKTLGDDFREGKITLPVLLAYREANEEEKTFWQRTMAEHNQTPQDFAQAITYIQRHKTIERTLDVAAHQVKLAKDALLELPQGSARDAMFELADFCLARAY